MLSNNPSSPGDALAHKYLPLAQTVGPQDAISFLITLDLQAIAAIFGFPHYHPNNLAPLSSSSLPAISMPPISSDMASSDDQEGFVGRGKPTALELLKEKKRECEELKEASNEATRTRWSLEKQLDQKTHDLNLALQTSESRYHDCVRLDGRLNDLEALEPKLEAALSEIKSLKKYISNTDREAQLREEFYETEKLSWAEDRERLQARISSLADALKHARQTTPDQSMSDPSSSAGQNVNPAPQIPPEIKKELSELHVVNKSYVQQELIEQLNQQNAEAENPQLQESLAAEISQASPSPKRPSTCSSESETKLLKLRRLNDSTKSGEVEDLRTTNQKLNDYLERLLNRIIGLEAFEHVLNVDFEAIRNGSSNSRQPVVYQAPTVRSRRAVSASLATKALRQLKAAKSKFLDKLNNSASAGVQVLGKPFAPKKNAQDHFATFAMLMPHPTSRLGSVEYEPRVGKNDTAK
ncbi:hypothetical protein PCANC_23607 [Puccinia coronata f. sp. avenae]|uniref:Uncharacterized protein n=1 Tax=Puccinia coronata f. sp. avenae TaxID=200324 RepID=A0A2N5S8M9_9BASI|nr:hypothetical protein PCANC_23607 [Puccinia coronata f. sp. avenae]PLW44164.1 hypothetical protein PCASD_09541 [Puccinia coronata f. sp. avenae]